MSQYSGKIISLSDFNADLIAAHFQVPPHRPYELDAMRFMFRIYGDELPHTGSKSARGKMVAEQIIEKMEFRYDLYNHFVDYFFKSSAQYDHKAIALAVICDEYITHANEPVRPHDDTLDTLTRRNDGLDEETVLKACIIWEEASVLEGAGMPEDRTDIEAESVFLAHINAIENLRSLEESFDDYMPEELEEILCQDFPKIRDFIMPHTLIGEKLGEFLDHMTAQIREIIGPPAAPGPKRPALRIVVDNTPAP